MIALRLDQLQVSQSYPPPPSHLQVSLSFILPRRPGACQSLIPRCLFAGHLILSTRQVADQSPSPLLYQVLSLIPSSKDVS